MWEVSTPFVHFRWFLYKIGKSKTKLYLYNGIAMMAVFGLCRIVWGACISLLLKFSLLCRVIADLGMKFFVSSMEPQDVVSPTTLWILRAICVALNGLNWYWFRAMVKGAFRLIVKKPLHFEERVSVQNGNKIKT